MAHTKHKSASVLQGYVDNSMQQKINVSSALAVNNKECIDKSMQHSINVSSSLPINKKHCLNSEIESGIYIFVSNNVP